MNVDLDKLICSTFRGVADDIINCKASRIILKGGRSSTKSQTATECIIVGCMVYKQSAVALIKYANKIEERLVNTFKESMRFLNVSKYWKLKKSPFEFILLDQHGCETDISIKFTGCDDAELLKSYKPRSGSFRYVWFEELNNFFGIDEVNNIIQTMIRGEGDHCTIMTYNPPLETSSWVNLNYNAPCGKILGYNSNSYKEKLDLQVYDKQYEVVQVIHHSTYLDIINDGHADWLGKSFILEAERSKKDNNKYYRFAYLGEVVGTDANVFNNIVDWEYDPNLKYDILNRGLDVGNGGQDPWAYNTWYFDKIKNCLYCLDEFTIKTDNLTDIKLNIKKYNKNNLTVYIDSAVPTFKNMLITMGLNIVATKKGRDSKMAGILWLQSLSGIYIDKIRCPETYREFKNYEYKINKQGELTNEIKDGNDHHIDCTRYAFNNNIKYGL